MSKKILVTFATHAGSTAEVAKAVGEEIAKCGMMVDVLPLDQVKAIDSYDGVVLGGPMIMGWYRSALGFLKKNRKAFGRVPLALFVTAMSLTQTGEMSVNGVPIYVDGKLPKPPQKEDALSFRERYARISNYAKPILDAARPAKPVSIAFFGGCLQYGQLEWWAVLFAMVIIQAPAGDRRNWTAIRAWGAGLPAAFQQVGSQV